MTLDQQRITADLATVAADTASRKAALAADQANLITIRGQFGSQISGLMQTLRGDRAQLATDRRSHADASTLQVDEAAIAAELATISSTHGSENAALKTGRATVASDTAKWNTVLRGDRAILADDRRNLRIDKRNNAKT